ncbi:hypothetical protein N1851_006413 [Merluccius polli]|uniref:Endonuclease/exonuclease/phosphatase domain-containing protein n=1 Tax=Merluccius polli TaxID=89951 RepID=A0AA47PAF0_MERPO|nr:hypothetical protein N1851_006413 [Merluccius polli]
MFVSNARSLIHKMDELELLIKGNHHVRDCCVSIITETWLHPLIPDTAVQLAGCTNHRWDRNKDSDTINKLQQVHPDGVHIIAGEFNQANLKSVQPKFYQHVKCPTRGSNTLDHVYTNIKQAYRAIPLPHSQSDHLSLLFTPAYIPLRRRSTPLTKTITTWPEDALLQLQDCFADTEWSIFEHQDLAAHTEAVLSYIKFYMGNVTVDKRIRIFPNQKPWMTSQVRMLLKDRNTTFRSGNTELYSAARANLKRGITKAKQDYKTQNRGSSL